ncbi:hypothetical protein [Methylobacterium planeticum]|uniref:Uncharacterized protein n=1 Tax=Methylobacterium planeticum TaxID=2615211 RepID=A0A6N6MKA6_9HYPH|nr:hypothetical protein [Methylobacterium planeticum]KAB1070039.1 hypothetical protein F6X51_23995 [Methylobacterium planeticum]
MLATLPKIVLVIVALCSMSPSAACADASGPACLPVGADGRPVLAFQQPDVPGPQVQAVVTNAVIPAWNRFQVLNAMAPAGTPLVPLTWNPNQFTGMPDLPPSAKWGSANAYANSAIMVSGRTVGLWADGADPDLKPSPAAVWPGGSLSAGCWFPGGNAPQLFRHADDAVTVAYDLSVAYDGAGGEALSQAYFAFIIEDRACMARHVTVASGHPNYGALHRQAENKCSLSFNITNYATNRQVATQYNTQPDPTGSANSLIINAGIDAGTKGATWLRKIAGSYHARPFSTDHIEFQLLASGVSELVSTAKEGDPALDISSDPTRYDLNVFAINNEVIAPCRQNSCGQLAQLGLRVSNFRVQQHSARQDPSSGPARRDRPPPR